jgi:hypothetical protein
MVAAGSAISRNVLPSRRDREPLVEVLIVLTPLLRKYEAYPNGPQKAKRARHHGRAPTLVGLHVNALPRPHSTADPDARWLTSEWLTKWRNASAGVGNSAPDRWIDDRHVLRFRMHPQQPRPPRNRSAVLDILCPSYSKPHAGCGIGLHIGGEGVDCLDPIRQTCANAC